MDKHNCERCKAAEACALTCETLIDVAKEIAIFIQLGASRQEVLVALQDIVKISKEKLEKARGELLRRSILKGAAHSDS